MWGIIPAAGAGSRIQPLAFSKELLPVGSRFEAGQERPRAVSEYLVERMTRGGADKICFVISPGKSDIMEYYGGAACGARVCYAVQPDPLGLCDSIFRAMPFIREDEDILIGLPDTVWFPEDGFCSLGDDDLSFLLFPVERPELFDAVIVDAEGRVTGVQVKDAAPATNWVWGSFKVKGFAFAELFRLWERRGRSDEYLGTLVNAWVRSGGRAAGVKAGTSYVDVGTVNGYREAVRLLGGAAMESGHGR